MPQAPNHANHSAPHAHASVASTSVSAHLLAACLSRFPRQAIARCLQELAPDEALFLDQQFQSVLYAQLRRGARARKQHLAFPDECPQGWVVGWFDGAFPERLRHIPDPPLLLYGRGAACCLSTPSVAVVGARRCTQPGRSVAEELGRDLVTAGMVVGSGLAYGVDAAAHVGALRGSGCTIAVLGGGLDQIYPARHARLYRAILEGGGAVISEYPPAAGVRKHQFVERNRLISGLSQGVVVVEAGLRSGALTTAEFAAEQGREVMAVPGPVRSHVSRGCHRLLQQGAALVTSAEDVLAVLGVTRPEPAPGSAVRDIVLSGGAIDQQLAKQVLGLLGGYPKTVDELVVDTQLPHQQLLELLSKLELAGFVEQGTLGYIARS
ncbi:MAG: DNA-processing protein DprA [Pseudomonadota bacterium]